MAMFSCRIKYFSVFQPIPFSSINVYKKMQPVRLLSTEAPPTNKGITSNKSLVYIGPLKTQIKIVKLFSLSSSAIGIALQPSIVYTISQTNVYMGIMTAVVSSMFFSTPFLLHWITKRYVIELQFDNETKVFTAKTLTLFNKVQEIKFTANDVTVPTLPGILSSFHVRGRPLFVDRRMVDDPDAYAHMMGLDKPFELLINDSKDD